MLDPRRRRAVDQAAGDGDDAPGEEALIELPVGALDGHRGVAAHTAALSDGERLGELALGNRAALGIKALGINGARGAADEAAVRGGVVVLIDEGEEPDVDVVQRRDGAEEIEAALAK